MDSMTAYSMKQAAIASGTAKMRVFDWEKAARLIKSYANNSILKIDSVTAGLKDDLEWTGACIFEKGKPNHDARPFLASIWATPIIVFRCYAYNDTLGEIEIDCWKYMDETEWNEYTVWPQVAIDILEGI